MVDSFAFRLHTSACIPIVQSLIMIQKDIWSRPWMDACLVGNFCDPGTITNTSFGSI